MKNLIFICLFILTLLSCKNDFDSKEYFATKLDQKYKHYLTNEMNDCKRRAFLEAEKSIDSVINKWISTDLVDTSTLPSLPKKPIKPDHIISRWKDPKTKNSIND